MRQRTEGKLFICVEPIWIGYGLGSHSVADHDNCQDDHERNQVIGHLRIMKMREILNSLIRIIWQVYSGSLAIDEYSRCGNQMVIGRLQNQFFLSNHTPQILFYILI